MNTRLLFVIGMTGIIVIAGNIRTAKAHTINEILDAIRRVETGGRPHNGEGARGDNGEARGPFQIHERYWRDSGVPGTYADCDKYEYSRKVVLAYLRRYCPDAVEACNAQVIARTHNGGPAGAKRKATIAYWKRVRHQLIGR